MGHIFEAMLNHIDWLPKKQQAGDNNEKINGSVSIAQIQSDRLNGAMGLIATTKAQRDREFIGQQAADMQHMIILPATKYFVITVLFLNEAIECRRITGDFIFFPRT